MGRTILLAMAGSPSDVNLLWGLPFVALLLAIALLPTLAHRWWDRHYPKIALGLAIIPAVYYFASGRPGPWLHEMGQYASFIILLASLFIISGGIHIRVNYRATPIANAVLLLLGAVLANVLGTTGASMLLIRPYLRMNRGHVRPYHVVFFIFIVSNIGGCLTPVGDPPLFLGYLSGVPFWWVYEHCRLQWLTAIGCLLAIFFIIDVIHNRRQERVREPEAGPMVQILGVQNLLFVALVLFAVFQIRFSDALYSLKANGIDAGGLLRLVACQELLMIYAAAASHLFTARAIYGHNQFTYAPIREVAILFIGIFSTMVPALQWLDVHAGELPLHTPAHYYFTCGAMSSVLDNAPTYASFLRAELAGLEQVHQPAIAAAEAQLNRMAAARSLDVPADLASAEARSAILTLTQYRTASVLSGTVKKEELLLAFLIGQERLNAFLVAISLGAVFFGACTYIGNAPNFMVRSIATSAGVRMPGFLAYIFFYTIPVLVPVLLLVWAIFFRSSAVL